MNFTGRYFRLTSLSPGIIRSARALALSLIVFGQLQLLGSAHAAEPLVIDSTLLRLTQQIDVPARAQGQLASIHVAEGDKVLQGVPLAQIDDDEAKLQQKRATLEYDLQKEKVKNDVAIRTAQKTVEFHRAERDRLQQASTRLPGSVSVSELEEHRFNAAQAELKLEDAQHDHQVDIQTMALKGVEVELGKHNVEIRRITAPVNGVVVEILRHQGEWVEPGEKVLRIVSIDKLRAEGLVHVSKLPGNLVGARVVISVDLPDKGATTFNGKVVFVSPEINPVNGQARVWAEIDNSSGLLRPGLRPQMKIEMPGPSAAK
jgi:multidrug efflux pump subunit AcrA (membrane-fusion protein)